MNLLHARSSLLLIIAGLLPYRWLAEQILVPDGQLESTLANFVLWLFRAALVLGGVMLLPHHNNPTPAEKLKATAVRQSSRLRKSNRAFVSGLVITILSIGLFGSWAYTSQPLFEVFDTPSQFTARYGDFTANIHGLKSRFARNMRYQLNNGDWQPVVSGKPRVQEPQFIVELAHEQLKPGHNTIRIKADAFIRETQVFERVFSYDTSRVHLPLVQDWSQASLEVDDGNWERFQADGEWRVRPRLGFESYDRILVVAGAFAGGRRVQTDVIFRRQLQDTNNYGFGLLPMWGGHPDNVDYARPRRGWLCSIAWFYDRYESVGNEFSYKIGDDEAVFVTSYRSLAPEPNIKYNVLVESWPVVDGHGNHRRFEQRMKWWRHDQEQPQNWIVLTDAQGARMPAIPYGVALLAYHCQIDFGPVTVEALPEHVLHAE